MNQAKLKQKKKNGTGAGKDEESSMASYSSQNRKLVSSGKD